MSDVLLQRLDQLEEALAARHLGPDRYRKVLDRWRTHLHRYAGLERSLLGDVWVTVPTVVLRVALPEDPLRAGDAVAIQERERFHLGRGETGDVMTLLDRDGLKVYRPAFPAEGPVEGIFLFDPEVGPALAVDGGLSARESDFVFARLYAHYVMENDPYTIRFALRGTGSETSVEDLRAQAFAAAFLVDREGLDRYLQAKGRREGTPITPETVRELALYFEVAPRTLLTRLLSLRMVATSEVPRLVKALEAEPSLAPVREPMPALGERFIRLALEAHAREAMDLDTLAAYLETDRETAAVLASEFVWKESSSREEEGETPS